MSEALMILVMVASAAAILAVTGSALWLCDARTRKIERKKWLRLEADYVMRARGYSPGQRAMLERLGVNVAEREQQMFTDRLSRQAASAPERLFGRYSAGEVASMLLAEIDRQTAATAATRANLNARRTEVRAILEARSEVDEL